MKDNPIAFDDRELRDWLMELIEDRSHTFLSALAEVAVTADPEDYGVIRPTLLEFRRKYFDRSSLSRRRFSARQKITSSV